jgi:hypothetical protein
VRAVASVGWKNRKGVDLQCTAGWPTTDFFGFDAQISARSGHGILWRVRESDWSIRPVLGVLA